MLLMQMVMKVADVSHPCKAWDIHVKWSELISSEFFAQGDKELAEGLAVSPLCNKDKHFLPKSQCDFVDFVVRPSMEVFSKYCKSDLWISTMTSNYNKWKIMYNEMKDTEGGKAAIVKKPPPEAVGGKGTNKITPVN